MQIYVNDKTVEVQSENTKLSHVLEVEGLFNQEGIAVAVNNNVIPKFDWEKYSLSENDHLTIIRAVQGG